MATFDATGSTDRLKATEADDPLCPHMLDDVAAAQSAHLPAPVGGAGEKKSCDLDAVTHVIRDGHGDDDIRSFDPDKDVIAFDKAEIRNFNDVRARMSEDNGDTIIQFKNRERLRIHGHRNSVLTASNFAFSAGPMFLAEGTPIMTERGEVAIEYLRPDDIVWTKDHGWQAIRLVTFERMTFKRHDDPAKPVLVPKGSLGNGTPQTELIISPHNRILQIYPDTGDEVLVPAVDLTGRHGIRRMRGKKKIHYLNIVMERHSIIQAAGCWVESLLVTSRSLSNQGLAARRLLDHSLGIAPARRIERTEARPRRLQTG